MTEKLENKFKTQKLVILSDEEYQQFMDKVEIIEERDTFFRDKIRILCEGNNFFIQEKSNKEEIIIRKTGSLKEGQQFIKNRLAVYENMWNGCGCKINYYT